MVFTVFDRKLREYQSLFTERNDETCRRALLQMKGSGTLMEKHAEDFDVFCVGLFDQVKGLIDAADVPRLVVNLKDVLEA